MSGVLNRKPRARCVSDPQRDFTFTVSPGANLLAAYRPGPPHALGRRRAFSRVTEEEWLIAVVVQALATVGAAGLGRRRMAEIRRPKSEREEGVRIAGQAVPGFDEVFDGDASDFERAGLKVPSVIRVARLGVVSEEMLVGSHRGDR